MVLVDRFAAGLEVEVVDPGGMRTPIPPTPGVVTRPKPVASDLANRPMKSSMLTVVGTPGLVPGSSSFEISAERTCGGSSEGGSTRRSTPAKIPRTRMAAVLRTIRPNMSRPTRTLSRAENRFAGGLPFSASRAAIRRAKSSGLGLCGPIGGGNGRIPFLYPPCPGGS